MKLREAILPLSVAVLREKYFSRSSLAVTRKPGENPFAGLLTLAEVETRLNDSCASLTNLSIIDAEGKKVSRAEIYTRQLAGAWAPEFVQLGKVRELLARGSSFVLHNMSQINAGVSELIADIESEFPEFQADAHLYVSPLARSTGFLTHRDQPQHKLYFQLLGSTRWTVYRGIHEKGVLSDEEVAASLRVDFEVTLTPGSFLYMPPATFHRVSNPEGPRLSLSVPFGPLAGALHVDRTHVSLAELFARER